MKKEKKKKRDGYTVQRKQLCKWGKRSVILAALVLFVGCARQMPPPGGPADRVAPYVVETFPVHDSVGVGAETVIRIHFSEKMDHKSVEEAIFISPQPAQRPTFRWRGDAIEVRLLNGLQKNRTYVITVGQASADEWRNRMLGSHTFRFATGQEVNRGELFGRVMRSKEQVGQAFVWVYDLDVVSAPHVASDGAHYVTQPNDTGHFHVSGLGPGVYRIFVFIDADQNKAYTAGVDALAIPPQDVPITHAAPPFRLGDLKAVVHDTIAPALSAVRTLDQNHVLMRFSEPIRVMHTPVVGGLEVVAVYQDVDSSRVGVFTTKQKGGQSYVVRVQVQDRAGNVAEIETSVKGDDTADRRVPEVLFQNPKTGAVQVLPQAPLEMVFSDAMAADVADPFWIVSDSTLAPEGHFKWTAPNQLVFMPHANWPDDRIHVQSKQGVVKDLAGNVLKGDLVFDFQVIHRQDLGRIAGMLLPVDAPVVIEAVSLERVDLLYRTLVAPSDSTFEMDQVLPGDYRVSGFVDADRNGIWNRGEAVPFRPAEVLLSTSDTVTVRSRWTVDTRPLETLSGWFLPVVEENP